MVRKKAAAANASATVQKAIRMALDSGKVLLGTRDATKQAMHGKGKLVVITSNMKADEAEDLRRFCALSNIPVLDYDGDNMDLGSVCGKPFPVSALWIGDVGNSPIMNFVQAKK